MFVPPGDRGPAVSDDGRRGRGQCQHPGHQPACGLDPQVRPPAQPERRLREPADLQAGPALPGRVDVVVVGGLGQHPNRGRLAQRPGRHVTQLAGQFADQAGQRSPQVLVGPALRAQHPHREQRPAVPEHPSLGELPVGVGRGAAARPDRGRRNPGQQQLDAARRMVGPVRRQQGRRGRQGGERLDEQAGRIAELENRGHAVPVDDDGGLVAGQIGLLYPGAGCHQAQQRAGRAAGRRRVPSGRVAQDRAGPLEDPSAAEPDPGDGEQGSGRQCRGDECRRALGGAGQQQRHGKLGADDLPRTGPEQPSISDRRIPARRWNAAPVRHSCRHRAASIAYVSTRGAATTGMPEQAGRCRAGPIVGPTAIVEGSHCPDRTVLVHRRPIGTTAIAYAPLPSATDSVIVLLSGAPPGAAGISFVAFQFPRAGAVRCGRCPHRIRHERT